ncbi:MAG TPA: hypothetical protein PLH97_09080, partial [Verrucomicrobiota bacterium]|nr:hypothetical protein [Verrucomicrobiota bacterium]
VRILHTESIDLHREGMLGPEETRALVRTTLAKLDFPPVALVLPQHLSTSQIIDLPVVQENEVQKLVEEESHRLSGVTDSPIVYDFVRAGPAVRNRQRFWVTLCQEREIRERIQRLGIEQNLYEISTTANALIAAYRAAAPLSSRAILVHMGAQSTVVVIVLEGQGVFTTSFQMGGDFLTRSLARLCNCSDERAEALKREVNFFTGPEAQPGFPAVVDGWVAELKRQLNEWFAQNPGVASEGTSMELVASGGAFHQPGLLDYLKQAHMPFRLWPSGNRSDASSLPPGYEVAYGMALQALGHAAQPVSLLPAEYRLAWKKQALQRRLELVSAAMVLVCVLVFAAATWHQWSLLKRKEQLTDKVRAASAMVSENARLASQVYEQYETLRPVFKLQQNTLDTLRTLALLQQSRTNDAFWYVVLADQQSYFSQPAALATNRAAGRTNPPVTPFFSSDLLGPSTAQPSFAETQAASPGYIAELCIPGNAESARTLLSRLVTHLKDQSLFSKVDLLSDDLRRNMADPKVIVPDRHFVLELDFAETAFHTPLPRPDSSPSGDPSRPGPRRSARPPWSAPGNSR